MFTGVNYNIEKGFGLSKIIKNRITFLFKGTFMNQELISKLKSEKAGLRERYNVTKLGVFGSYARGEEKPDSDSDLLIEFENIPGMTEFFGAEEYLENVLNIKIDLVRESAIRPELKKKIMSEVIYI